MALTLAIAGNAFAQGAGIGTGIDDILPRGNGTLVLVCPTLLTGGTDLLTGGANLLTGCQHLSGPLLTIGTNLATTGTDLSAK